MIYKLAKEMMMNRIVFISDELSMKDLESHSNHMIDWNELDQIVCPYCQGVTLHQYGELSTCSNCNQIIHDGDILNDFNQNA